MIMTEQGWRQLSPTVFLPPSPEHPPRYAGGFPSAALVAHFNDQKELMKYFDDGVRMMYGRPDRVVETDNAEPTHPVGGWR